MQLTKTQIEVFIICLMLLIVAGTHRFSLKDYEEECFEYQKVPYVTNFSYQDYKDGKYCYRDRSGYWGLNCSIIIKYHLYNSTRNGECIKYHLVRRV